MTNVNAQPEKESYILVSFEFESSAYRFTNLSTTIDPEGANYIAMPTMEVDLPANSGALDKAETKITLPITDETEAFLEPLSRGTPFAPVEMTLTEVIKPMTGGDPATILTHVTAMVARTIRNPNNRKNRVTIIAESPKNKLDVPMGIPCTHECPWTLYAPPCGRPGSYGPQKNSEKKVVTLTAINGRAITISGAYSLSPAGKSYRFGWVEYGDARAGIREWAGSNVLWLTRQLPVEWIGQQITLVPGCDHSVDYCRDVMLNETRFGGIGLKIPAHNPVIEEPTGFDV